MFHVQVPNHLPRSGDASSDITPTLSLCLEFDLLWLHSLRQLNSQQILYFAQRTQDPPHPRERHQQITTSCRTNPPLTSRHLVLQRSSKRHITSSLAGLLALYSYTASSSYATDDDLSSRLRRPMISSLEIVPWVNWAVCPRGGRLL